MKPWLRSRAALKWVALGLVIGAVSGGLAVAFEETLLFGTHLLLGLAGYQPATLAGDPGGFHPATAFAHPWAIPLIAGAGRWLCCPRVLGGAGDTGSRHRSGDLGNPPRTVRPAGAGDGGEDAGLRRHDRVGRFGRQRGTDRADRRDRGLGAGPRLRLTPRTPARR